MTTLIRILIVAAGGGLGAGARYLMQGFVQERSGSFFPWGTLAVNLFGCFLIGLLWALFDLVPVRVETRLFLITGILGGYTTFSSFGLETMNLLRSGQYLHAALNVTVSNGAGLVCVFIGMILMRGILSAVK
jgi:CrcB protein